MNYKRIDTNGIEYLDTLQGTDEWYWGSDFCMGDLYEAEDLFQSNRAVKGNRLVFVKYPEGDVVEPIPQKEGQYFGSPIFFNGVIVILLVDFYENKIKVISYHDESKELKTMAIIDRFEITDSYKLLLHISPLFLSGEGNGGIYKILWPERTEFHIEDNETIFQREDEILISSIWTENPEYHEDIMIRRYPTGEILDRFSGNLIEMPDKQRWIVG
ncbi:MAG: hypothetical protein SPL15_06715 [Lachnospiraceae bacterium]|nr:hypothetical protein [Lachnospiraceae bacterium]MDY5742668.1 hypothetical protein [Lachnospiraceae bacterium]